MSATLNEDKEEKAWNFRVNVQRLIVIKTKAPQVRKAAALDVLTNLSFTLNVPDDYPLETLEADKEYFARLRVYTSKDLQGVETEFIPFFDALDIDQSVDDFIKAYWVYPNKIRFELVEVEEP